MAKRTRSKEWEMRVAAESTRAEAMKKARKYIKPGHRRIRKVGNMYEVWAVESGSF